MWQHFSQAMKILPVPCLTDNYAYLIIADSVALCIDPVQPKNVLGVLEKTSKASLSHALTTHHHWDHAGGNEELKRLVPAIQIVGGDDRVQAIERKVQHGDILTFGPLEVNVIGTGCHTRGSVSYYIRNLQDNTIPGAVFTGDTLFRGGCGKFFEGTPDDMLTALNRLKQLPKETLVYCGHEYTKSNYTFALAIDPRNEYLRTAQEDIQNVECTVPSTIKMELLTNPFMRTDNAEIQKAMGTTDQVQVMGRLRDMKNNMGGWYGTLKGGLDLAYSYAKYKLGAD